MGALTGTVFDVIDVDPRSGGSLSLKQMAKDLGEDGPEEYWRVRTSSGGLHIYVSPLGLGGHNGFMPGLDLKSKGGFVFIPPTVRPSKDARNTGAMVAYTPLTPLVVPPNEDATGGYLRDYITEKLAAKRGERTGSRKAGRELPTRLEQDCLDAERGEQHDALLALVDELARKYDDDEYVVFLAWRVAQDMKNFDKANPWREADVRGLMHRPGRRPIADATDDEKEDLAGISASEPLITRAVSGLKSFSDVESALTRWLWLRYLALGDATLVDADAGMGKSITSVDIVARASTGRPMPGEAESIMPAVNCLILAPEDRPEVIKARLQAAGADLARVFMPEVEIKKKPGQKEKAYFGGHMITFPDNVEQFHRWIKMYNIGLVIVDPIAAFLGEKVDAHKDSSVRKALEPFVLALGQEKATAWLIRHLNKDTKQSAAFRGGGSVAFGAVARTHLFTGMIPDTVMTEGTHAIAVIKSNNLKKRKDIALAYEIVDSDIRADDDGNYVPRVKWHGEITIDLQVLAGGLAGRRGPEATVQPKVRAILDEMFAERERWPAKQILMRLEGEGITDHKIIDKVKDAMGVRSVRVAKRGSQGGTAAWYWTVATERVGE